jgi:hypothetical protein
MILGTDSDTDGRAYTDGPKRARLCTRAIDDSGSEEEAPAIGRGGDYDHDYDMDGAATRVSYDDNSIDVSDFVPFIKDGYVWSGVTSFCL